MKPTGLENEAEKSDKEYNYYDASQQEYYNFLIKRLTSARSQRGQNFKELDDQTYEVDYELNKQAANAYLRNKKNDDEVRIVGGTTEKKVEHVMNEILAMNLQPDIDVYDKYDRELADLGSDFEDLVKRTNEIEDDETFWIEFLHEFLTQRAVFVEEAYVDLIHTKKKITSRGEAGKKSKYKEKEVSVAMARKKVLSGLQVFLADLSIPAYLYDTQPYIFTYDRVSYAEAQSIYGDWENWKHVQPSTGHADIYNLSFKYRFGSLMKDEVEIIKYYSLPDGEQMLLLSGVMMYEPGEPLHSERDSYPIRMYIPKPMGRNFALGKSLVASAKTLQGLSDETIRLMVRKFRQALEPPVGIAGSRVFSKDIYSAGAQTQGISKDTITRLIDHDGVTKSEFAMYDLINRKTEEFIGQSGLTPGLMDKKMTAAQYMEMQKEALRMLGLSILGVKRAKKDLTYQRIYTVLENYLEPVEKRFDPVQKKVFDVYQSFTIKEGTFENGKKGTKIIQFTDQQIAPEVEDSIIQWEEKQESMGNPIRFQYRNVQYLKNVPKTFKVSVNPTERDGSAMNKALFQDKIAQAQQLSEITHRPLNADEIIDDFERTWKVKNLFQKAAPPNFGGQPAEDGANSKVGAAIASPTTAGAQSLMASTRQ